MCNDLPVCLCQVRRLIKENIFQHQLRLFSPGDGHLQKNGVMLYLPLTHGDKQTFSEIAMIKKPSYLAFGRAVSGLNVGEPKFSSLRTLRVSQKNENVIFVNQNYVQTHDNKFNAK